MTSTRSVRTAVAVALLGALLWSSSAQPAFADHDIQTLARATTNDPSPGFAEVATLESQPLIYIDTVQYDRPVIFETLVSRTPARAKRLSTNWQTFPALAGPHEPGQEFISTIYTPRGTVLCVTMRARTGMDAWSPWSRRTCVSRAFDDRFLKSKRAKVKLVRNSHYADGSASQLLRGTLRLPHVRTGSKVSVFTTTPPKARPDQSVRVLRWALPGKNDTGSASGYGRKRKFGDEWLFPGRAKERGPLRVTKFAGNPSMPLEGVAIIPPWQFPAP